MHHDIEKEIAAALEQIVIARDAAAAPLTFATDAAAESDQRSADQFRASLPQVKGGFATVKKGLLHASSLFGVLAKTIAQFQDPAATQINLDQMHIARAAAEKACRLTLATQKGKTPTTVDVSDGLICS